MERKLNKTDNRKRIFISALEKSFGIITETCRKVSLSRAQFYLWYNTDPAFKIEVDDVLNIALDHVEGKLFELIDEKNPAAIIFYLKTKGKRRGYIERQEVDTNIDELKDVIRSKFPFEAYEPAN